MDRRLGSSAFYAKDGYELFGELTGVPPGSNLKWMRKGLAMAKTS